MAFTRNRFTGLVALVTALVVITTIWPALSGRGADHLDGPDSLTPPGGEITADIADLYAFEGADSTATVLAATVRPLAHVGSTFDSEVLYELKVDTDGDFIEDISYEVTFDDAVLLSDQVVTVREATGPAASDDVANGTEVAAGATNTNLAVTGGGEFFAGLRSDPFFFDLDAFINVVELGNIGTTGRQFADADANDFFEGLDVLALVLELPDATFGGPINVWATTHKDGAQIDRIGRPAINTVVNSSGAVIGADKANKTAFNQAEPKDDAQFTSAAADALTILSGLDTEGPFAADELTTLAGILLPDVLPFDKAGALPPPLNGRALADDVIDVELNIVTGGDPLDILGPDRDENGAITGDGVGPHSDYLSVFPYLGEPNFAAPTEGVSDDFLADLLGANEVPPVASPAAGVATMSLENDDSELEYLLLVYGLNGAVAAHIHLGEAGENGPVVATLYASGGEDVSGTLAQGTITASDLASGTMPELASALRNGFAYVNVHTAAYPGGELRGQVSVLDDTVTDPFTDDDASVHEANIGLIARAGITFGCNPPDNDNFCPTDNLTRGQMAAFMSRALNLPETTVDFFTDDDTSIFEAEINRLAASGITLGCNPPDNDNYCPTDNITRGQMAAFIARAWSLPASTTDYFTDDDTSIFEGDINAIREAGVAFGTNPPANTEYSPTAPITRAQMASLLARALGWGS